MYLYFFLMIRPPPRSTPFPYTTLFRSDRASREVLRRPGGCGDRHPRPRVPGRGARAHRDAALTEEEITAWRSELSWQDRTGDRKSTRLNSSHANISYAVFCLKKKSA